MSQSLYSSPDERLPPGQVTRRWSGPTQRGRSGGCRSRTSRPGDVAELEPPLDAAYFEFFVPLDEGDDEAVFAGSGRAPGSVQVLLLALGRLKCTTSETGSMWIPRAATSVVTSTGREPSENRAGVRSRWLWTKSQWSGDVATPSR